MRRAANGDGNGGSDNFDNVKDMPATGNERAYLESRLKRDFPEIFDAYQAGQYRSARQAALAAGIIKDSHDPLLRLKAYWKKATKAQRQEFKKWLRTKSDERRIRRRSTVATCKICSTARKNANQDRDGRFCDSGRNSRRENRS